MLPLLISLIYVGSVKFDDWQRNHNSLVYNVNHGNYARVEALLKEGANPDCTLHNLPADEGKKALLSYMCENNGFMDEFDNPVDASLTREEREMMQLLIDYGADVTAVTNYGQDVNDLFAQNEMLDRTHMQKIERIFVYIVVKS